MIIGIDGNEANVEKRVGIGQYAFELLRQFSNSKFKIQNSKFIIYLKDKPLGDMPQETDNWKYQIVRPKKMWTQLGLPFYLFTHKLKPDIFFTPTHYSPRFCPSPTTVSIMDLSYIHYPNLFKKTDLYQLKNWTKYSVKKASLIFTISNASKDDIIKIYGIRKEKIVVTYPGRKTESNIENRMLNMDEIKSKYGISSKYILFVGTLQPRKNITGLIEAFKKISDQGNKDFELVIVGKKGWLYEEILETPKKLGIENKVKFLDFVSDDDLPSFYKNAFCFVLPSFYEGFGLPIIEAMRHGCPVVTSNVSSLPEVGGDAALYVDPKNIDDIAEKIQLLIKDEKLKKELIEKGYGQIKKFDWKKTAEETLKALKELVKE